MLYIKLSCMKSTSFHLSCWDRVWGMDGDELKHVGDRGSAVMSHLLHSICIM